MPLALHHLAVRVADLARAEAFYSGVVGLRVLQRHEDDRGAPRAIWLELGAGAFLALELAPSNARAPEGGPSWHCVALGIETAHRDAMRERLAAAGHAVERESPFTLYARDPDKNLVAFSHHPEPATR